MAEYDETDAGLRHVRGLIAAHPNFPIPGVLFHDGTTQNANAEKDGDWMMIVDVWTVKRLGIVGH